MKAILLLKRLEKFPLFTQNDLAKITDSSQKYVKTLLYRLSRKSYIKRIERGKYTVYDDALIFVSHIVNPSYISLWTALRYYNLTQQQPTSYFVMSPVKRRRIKIHDSEIIFIPTKHMFGYKKIRHADFDIFIAEPEKAIIDSLHFKIPIEDISFALENKSINFKKLSEYAYKTGDKSLIKRLGYLLEKKTGSSYGLKALDNNYILLNYLDKKKGKRNKKWKVIVNQ